METIFNLIPTFDDNLNCNLLVRRTFKYEGEIMKVENWRTVLAKGADLTVPLDTSYGLISLNEFPAERDYIAAKWAQTEEPVL